MPMTVSRCMRRSLSALSLSLAILLVATDLAPAAGPPFPASGTSVTTSFEQSNVRYAPPAPCDCGIAFYDLTIGGSLSGTFNGSQVLTLSCVQSHSGEAHCHGTNRFVGTVAGVSGTLTLHNVLVINFVTGTSHGSFTVTGGTGGLAHLHGHGTSEGETYTGLLTFA
jgi:hypothetical protein